MLSFRVIASCPCARRFPRRRYIFFAPDFTILEGPKTIISTTLTSQIGHMNRTSWIGLRCNDCAMDIWSRNGSGREDSLAELCLVLTSIPMEIYDHMYLPVGSPPVYLTGRRLGRKLEAVLTLYHVNADHGSTIIYPVYKSVQKILLHPTSRITYIASNPLQFICTSHVESSRKPAACRKPHWGVLSGCLYVRAHLPKSPVACCSPLLSSGLSCHSQSGLCLRTTICGAPSSSRRPFRMLKAVAGPRRRDVQGQYYAIVPLEVALRRSQAIDKKLNVSG